MRPRLSAATDGLAAARSPWPSASAQAGHAVGCDLVEDVARTPVRLVGPRPVRDDVGEAELGGAPHRLLEDGGARQGEGGRRVEVEVAGEGARLAPRLCQGV